MCGIAGIIGPAADKMRIEAMTRALARRGPDDCGIWTDPTGGAVLGHTRLSIIDLSPAGHQPMTHGSGRYWITFNGEIYNYQELCRELESAGATFASHSDTEVILAAFMRWGLGCLRRLRGMFAFAVWDRQERRLFLVRDRLGIKPLLWAEASDSLVFASEIKAMLASGLIESSVEPHAIFDLLATGSVCQPNTILQGVRTLEPGMCLIIDDGGKQRTVRYWDATESAMALRPELAQLSYNDNVRLLREKLEEACRYHLIADVPVGSFLSGGIDSTAVTALMSRHMFDRVKSFSIGFESTPEVKHELDAARLAAQHIGCEHTEVVLTGRDMCDAFDDFIRTIDQPSYDGTNTYFVSRAAHTTVKVTLSGLGGDELFAGYPHFSWLWDAASRDARWPDRILSALHRFRPNRLTRPAVVRCQTVEQRYADLRRSLSDDAITASLAEPLRATFRPGFVEAYIQPFIDGSLDSLSQVSLVECRHYLLNTLLRDADVMGMGHGLEVRPVLLDHVLVEHALALSPETKMCNGRRKAILVDAVRDLLPPALLTRPKTGFELPLGTWLRTVLRERVLACLDAPWAHSVFAPSFLAERMHRLDEPRETKLIWTLMVLISWAEECHCTLPD